MTLVGRDILKKFTDKHPDAISWIDNWVADVEGAKWKSPQDIKRRYSTVSFLPGKTVYFNVKGNSYRLEVIIAYPSEVVMVKWIGTHAEYDKVDATTV